MCDDVQVYVDVTTDDAPGAAQQKKKNLFKIK